MNSLHKIVLSIAYGDKTSSVENLLRKDSTVSTHQKILQALATQMFKTTMYIIKVLFLPKISLCDLSRNCSFSKGSVNFVRHGT